MNEKVNTKTH